MIHYQLRCDQDHEFDGWFRNNEAFEAQASAGEIVCVTCGDRQIDKAPMARLGFWLSREPIRAEARELIERYNVRTPSPDTPIRDLSGGNVQRAVLARELSGDVDVLIVANPCFGLDFASVADIRSQIMEQRNRGAAVLLVSEDLDEILELSDRIAVMSGGKVAYLTDGANADRTTIGRHMAGH